MADPVYRGRNYSCICGSDSLLFKNCTHAHVQKPELYACAHSQNLFSANVIFERAHAYSSEPVMNRLRE